MKLNGLVVATVFGVPLAVFGFFLWRSEQAPPNDDRLDNVERDVAALKDEIRRLTTNDNALMTTTADELGNVAGRLMRAGITDEDNKAVMHWWCVNGNGLCLRTEAECKAKIEQFRREMPDDKRVTNAECVSWRIAYCDDRKFCVGTLKQCEGLKRGACVGVE